MRKTCERCKAHLVGLMAAEREGHEALCDEVYDECAKMNPELSVDALVNMALSRLPYPYETYFRGDRGQ